MVLRTTAAGLGDLGDTPGAIAGRIVGWVLRRVGRPGVCKQVLTGGRPCQRRVVIGDFARRPEARAKAPRNAVDLAETLLPTTPGVTRAVVIVTDSPNSAHGDLW
ncbi:hypothetical protein [Streptomyces sp. NPDC001770]